MTGSAYTLASRTVSLPGSAPDLAGGAVGPER